MASRLDSRALRDLRGESDFPPASSPGDALIGALVAERYRVVRKLGEGAQASVYVAKHTLIKRLVALKVLSSTVASDPELVRRFLDEGQVAGTMGHPNIVESLDMGAAEDGRPFLVLEYLEGTTIADELDRRGALDLGRVAYIGLQVASALDAAHQRGIVHRDLKPENVFLVDRNGHGDHVKVLDFGISKLESRPEGAAHAGLVVGTPDYMAPEQVTDPVGVDSRADVFALGAMLYEMLSGRLPLDAGAEEDVLDVVVRRTPAPLGELCPHLPPSVIAAVERAMRKDRTMRTQTIAEVHAALEPFAVASPVAATTSLPASGLALASLPRVSGVVSVAESKDSGRLSGVSMVPAPPASRNALAASDPPSARAMAIAPPPNMIVAGEPVEPAGARAAAVTGVSAVAAAAPVAATDAPVPAPRGSSARGVQIGLASAVIGATVAGALVFAALRTSGGALPAAARAAAGGETPALAAAASNDVPSPAANGPAGAATTPLGLAPGGSARPGEARSPLPVTPAAKPRSGGAPRAAARPNEAPEAPGEPESHGAPVKTGESAVAAAGEASASNGGGAALAAAAPGAREANAAAPAPATPARSTVLPFGEGMTRPSAIDANEIQYTREAREAKVSGVMIVRCTITTEGSLHSCRVMKSVPMMDQAVLSTLARHRGTPVMYQGRPVSVEYTYTIKLQLPE